MTRVILTSLFFLVSFLFFLRMAIRKRRGTNKRSYRPGRMIGTLILSTLLMIGVSLAVQFLSVPESTPPWEPNLPSPVKDQKDVFPQGPGSLLRSFSMTYYNLKETTVKNEMELLENVISLLDENRENGVSFSLPEEVVVRGSDTSDKFKIAESLSDYDKQILDASRKTEAPGRSDRAYQYRRISVSSLNCLDSLSRKCKAGVLSYHDVWDEFLYYSELAVWALLNEYIFSPDLTGGERVDLFYRIAQAYDHAGTATTDEDPPFKHELYFISAVFLELSFRSLKIINFSAEGHEYRSAVWILYMTMHLRMGKYVDVDEDFFKMFEDCKKELSKLTLTSGECAGIKELEENLDEWRELHGTK